VPDLLLQKVPLLGGHFDELDYAARMADATERGYNKTVYHGTYAQDMTQIDPNKVDLGLHVGTPEQATNRLKDIADPRARDTALGRHASYYDEGANILPLRVRANNPLELKDVGNWRDSHQVLTALRDSPAFVKNADKIVDMLEEADELLIQHEETYSGQFKGFSWSESNANRRLLDEIRSTIQDEGYDSVKYLNEVENVYGAQSAGDPYSYIILDPADAIGGISLSPRFRDGGAVKRAQI